MGEKATEPAPLRINSVGRGINILLEIARTDKGLTVRELSERLGIERQTLYHLVHTLTALSMIARDENRRYRLGLGVGELARGFERQFSAPDYVLPVVRQLALETGETCYAVGWWHSEIVTLAVARGTRTIQTAEVPHGQYADAHARAAGKLLLALSPASRRIGYLDHHSLTARTPETIVTPAALDREFSRIRSELYAAERGEFAAGVCCLAVPLGGIDAPFALALSAPAERFEEGFDRYLAIAQRLARGDRAQK